MKIEIEIEERRFELVERVAKLLNIGAEEFIKRLLTDAIDAIPESIGEYLRPEELRRLYL